MVERVSGFWSTTFAATGFQKLGHPVPESNFVSEPNNSWPQQTHRYVPASCLFQYSPVNARSVPFFRATRYCSGVSCFFHSSSVLCTLAAEGLTGCLTTAFGFVGAGACACKPQAIRHAMVQRISTLIRVNLLIQHCAEEKVASYVCLVNFAVSDLVNSIIFQACPRWQHNSIPRSTK